MFCEGGKTQPCSALLVVANPLVGRAGYGIHVMRMARTDRQSATLKTPAQSRAQSRRAPGVSPWLASLLLVTVTLAAYWPALGAKFIWDDNYWLSWNPVITSGQAPWGYWTSIKTADYWPLTGTLFWAQQQLWGNHPAGFHAVNLALHITASLLLWRVLRRLAVPGALLAAIIFAVHPVTVASAAWVTEQKNTLSLLLMLGSVWAYLRFDESPRRPWYGAALALFALALLAKSSVVILPAVLLGCVWWRRGKLSRRDVALSLPFWLLTAAAVALALRFQLGNYMDEPVDGPANLAERLVLASRAFWFYAAKAVLPVRLAMVYPRWNVHVITAAGVLALVALLAAMVALPVLSRRRWARPLAFGLGYYFLALLPTLGLVNMGFMVHSFVADHWHYLALPGAMALVVGVFSHSLAGRGKTARAAGWTVAAAIVVVLAGLTNAQARTYEGIVPLWRHNLTVNPSCIAAHIDLAIAEFDARNYPQALWHYQQILPQRPKWAPLHDRIGRVYCQMKDYSPAVEAFAQAAALDSNNAETRYWLGWTLVQLDRMAEAREPLEFAVAARPDSAEAHFHLGLVLADQGERQAALTHLRRATELSPRNVVFARQLALVMGSSSAPATTPAGAPTDNAGEAPTRPPTPAN